jgi:hypothetical protein
MAAINGGAMSAVKDDAVIAAYIEYVAAAMGAAHYRQQWRKRRRRVEWWPPRNIYPQPVRSTIAARRAMIRTATRLKHPPYSAALWRDIADLLPLIPSMVEFYSNRKYNSDHSRTPKAWHAQMDAADLIRGELRMRQRLPKSSMRCAPPGVGTFVNGRGCGQRSGAWRSANAWPTSRRRKLLRSRSNVGCVGPRFCAINLSRSWRSYGHGLSRSAKSCMCRSMTYWALR